MNSLSEGPLGTLPFADGFAALLAPPLRSLLNRVRWLSRSTFVARLKKCYLPLLVYLETESKDSSTANEIYTFLS